MSDDHAKQSTDNDSGQNTAQDAELHRAMLYATNPAFHTLSSMNLKGALKPVIVHEPSIVKTIGKNDESIEKLGEEDRIEDDSGLVTKKYQDDSTVGLHGELSHFSQWLSTLASPVLPKFADAKKLEAKEITNPKHGKHSKKAKKTKPVVMPDSIEEVDKVKKEKKAHTKKKKKKIKSKQIKESGVVLSDDIFSETLADLLASQGHTNQAIHMYQKMSLIYPEKSRFFAAKIEKLIKKG